MDNKNTSFDTIMAQAVESYECSIAKIILLCIDGLEFNLGINKLSQILTGNQTRFITEYELQKNRAYGVLSQFSKREIKIVIQMIEDAGYIKRTEVNMGREVLSVTTKGYSLLQGEISFDTSFIDALMNDDFIELDESQKILYGKLRKLRYKYSSEEDLPAYCVCSEMPLMRMSSSMPTTEEDLCAIKGIGRVFMEKYGEDFLREIRQFVEANE